MAYRKTEFVERKRLETRARIVEAATSLVRVAGWRGCVLKTVAQRAGISTGSLYTHFTKISDLYTEAYNVIATGEYAVIAEIAKGDEPPLERLTTAIDTFTGRAIRGRVQAYAMIGEPWRQRSKQTGSATAGSWRASLRQSFATAWTRGRLRPKTRCALRRVFWAR